MARLELSLLGGFHASVDGSQVTGFDTDKSRALLVYICMERSRAHSREALAGLLWPELPEEAARRNLRNSFYKLRQALGEGEDTAGFFALNMQTAQLDPSADCLLDAATFSSLIAACRTHRHRKPQHCFSCHTRQVKAVELYKGDFLMGFHLVNCQTFEEWLVLEREELHREALDTLRSLSAYHEARGENEQALRYAYRQLELESWREEAHRQVMRLLALDGQRSAALAQYETCCRALEEELSAEPSAETTALYERIKAGSQESGIGNRESEGDSDSRFPIPDSQKHNLPRQLAPFIGRDEELSRILERLDSPDYSLITLVGPGGVGKTRLALQAAGRQMGAFDDGVYWVPLASISSAQFLESSIAQALGFHFEASEDPQAQLLNYLRDKEMLLLLDNFEHLLEANSAIDLLLSIIKSAHHVSMLVTSRERLGLQNEFVLDLSGLPLPSSNIHKIYDPAGLMEYDAVQLFVERAQQVDWGFALTGDRAQGVVDICRLVNGLPLGIVLAAAWVHHFPPSRIAQSISDNLDFLSSTARDASPQHASLRAVFNHSWNLLSEEEQRVLRNLPVFRGGWDEEAAERVAGATINSLLSLADKSLLRRDATGRFEIHEVLRQYATEKSEVLPKEQEEVKRRHAMYYLELAQLAEPGMRGEEQGMWLAWLEREHDNMRAALHWARENQDAEIGIRLGAALSRFWYVRSYYSEGREQLAAVLAIPYETQVARRETQVTSLATQPVPTESADQDGYTELMRARSVVLNGAAVLATVQGDPGKARALNEESLAVSRSVGDKQGMASALNNLGNMAHQQGDSAAGRALHEESLAIRREIGDTRGIAASLNNLGLISYYLGEYDESRKLHEESLAIRRELRDAMGIAASLYNLGLVAQELDEYDEAHDLYEGSLALRKELGDKGGMAELYGNLGLVAKKQGNYDVAHDLYEQGLTLSRELGYTWNIALLLSNLGVVAQERGDYDAARALHKESLSLRRELGEKINISASLACLGALAAAIARSELEPQVQLGQLERAATLFGAVDRVLESTPTVLDSEDRQLYEQNLAAVRSSLNEDAFARAWAEGRALSLEQAIDYALEG